MTGHGRWAFHGFHPGRWLRTLAWVSCFLVPLDGAAGQGLSVQGRRDLAFGAVIAGMPTSVPRTDQTRVARFRIRGTKSAEVLIQFSLPTVLVNGSGQNMPISFGPDDGGWSTTQNISSMTGFDPTVPLIQRLASNNGQFNVVLGGTVSPPLTSTAGQYANTITMTVAYTGN